MFLPALEALPLVGILVVLWYGAHRVLAGDITIGTFALFNVYLALLVFPLRTIGQRVSTVQRGAAAARRVVDVLEAAAGGRRVARRRGRSRRGATCASTTCASRYGDERPILDGLRRSTIPAGTSLALVGATGSGKSTVAALLARFYDPDGGRVTIGGVDVRELRLEELRRGVGLVFEETFLFGDTVRGNVGFAIARRRRGGRSAAPRGSPAPPSSSSACPRATRRCSASAASRSRAASGSGSRSRARSSPTRRC